MKTSEAIRNGYKCPVCQGELAEDKKGRGYVRHKYRMKNNKICTYGKGDKDKQTVKVSQ